MGGTIRLGRILGIKFQIHFSWFIIFILVSAFLILQVFPDSLPGQEQYIYWIMGLVTAVLFFTSVLIHEMAHSLVGQANGIPIKNITLFIFGGAAQSTREAESPGAEFKMAIAGPLTSMVLAGMFGLLYLALNKSVDQIAAVALWLAWINMVLAVFNLLPGFPLDGGRVFRSIVWRISGDYRKSTVIASYVGRGIGFIIITGGVVIIFLTRDIVAGIWLALIGWFVESAARSSYHQLNLQQLLKGFTVSQVMDRDCLKIPEETTVGGFINDYTHKNRGSCVFLENGGKIKAVVELKKAGVSGAMDREKIRLKDFAVPIEKLGATSPDENLLGIAQQMNEKNIHQIPVYEGGDIHGLVTLESIIGFVNQHTEIKKG